jgi:hypothetical protein
MSREDGPYLVQVPIHDCYGKPIRLIQIGASASDEQRLDYVAKAAPPEVFASMSAPWPSRISTALVRRRWVAT